MAEEAAVERCTVTYLRSHLSELLRRTEAGETCVITRRGKVVARLVGAPARPEPSAADRMSVEEAGRRLAALGGSDPNATAAPRRRFW